MKAARAERQAAIGSVLPKLSDIKGLFSEFTLEHKRQFLAVLFPQGIWWENGIGRTALPCSLLKHNALIIK
jgi:hypothetical protein